jgi:hypothetical protein
MEPTLAGAIEALLDPARSLAASVNGNDQAVP